MSQGIMYIDTPNKVTFNGNFNLKGFIVMASGASSAEIGAAGGNVGLLDGSVSWRPIGLMNVYRGSRKWDEAGCWAMW